MSNLEKLGLGNTLPDETEILHTSLIGKRAFGRVADLLLAWMEKRFNPTPETATEIRVVTQALLEFAYPEGKQDMGYFEFAVEGERRYVSVRFPMVLKEEVEHFEKIITDYWTNSPRSAVLRKVLGPFDRVEVRFNVKLSIIEWRVISSNDEKGSGQLQVFVDGAPKVNSTHKKYVDLGDLPFEQLLEEVYHKSENRKSSNELFFDGKSLQKEEEAARVVFEKETQDIEELVRFIAEKATDEDLEGIPEYHFSESETKEIESKTDLYLKNTVAKLQAEKIDAEKAAQELLRESKRKELQNQRQLYTFNKKINQLEDLLKKKEKICVRAQNQVTLMSDKVTQMQVQADNGAGIKAFREKAIQMHAKLKKVMEENADLEKTIQKLKNRELDSEVEGEVDSIMARNTSATAKQIETLTKSNERIQRALTNEKAKVKQLSERALTAEQESLTTGQLVEGLERRVELSLRLTQQHKKEAESTKQKLLQVETEKNKLQNELTAAQNQINSMKRRAS